MMAETPWIWDASRRAHYYLSEAEQCYVYQDGTKIPVPQQTPRYQNPEVPRTNTSQQDAEALQQTINSPYPYAGHRRGSSGESSYDLARNFSGLGIGSSNQPLAASHGHPVPSYLPQPGSSRTQGSQPYPGRSSLQTGPPEETTDKELLAKGARVRGKIKGTKGKKERLDENFFKRTPGRKFFRVGKVIKILWPELPGNNVEGMTVVSDARFHGESIITKIRWFVVVKEGRESCTCVPISTYGSRGCTKPGLAKWQHCIVFSDKNMGPVTLPGEDPEPGEAPMLSPVEVRSNAKQEKMFDASRINFGKMYTVEHNVKVYDFGDVRRSHIPLLVAQWKWVLDCDLKGNTPDNNPEMPNDDEEEEEQEEDTGALDTIDDSEDDDDDAEPPFPIHGTALFAWNEGRAEGQLTFAKDDRISVSQYVDDDWSMGRNENTQLTGIFPQNYVRLDKPDYAHATREIAYDKNKAERLDFKIGDKILLLRCDSQNWDVGRNLRTGREGKYPYRYVKMARGAFAVAICDYGDDEDDSKPDHLVFKAGDRMLVTHHDAAGWSRGRNELTRREGRFPGSYVQF